MERGWPGVAALVETEDGSVEMAAAGLASLETRSPIRTGSAFHVCSINKTFTAVAILRLVEQGRLSLDQQVVTILDQTVVNRIPNIGRVTVAQLLDHSSGIYPTINDAAYLRTLIGDDAFTGRVWRPEEMVELATRSGNTPDARHADASGRPRPRLGHTRAGLTPPATSPSLQYLVARSRQTAARPASPPPARSRPRGRVHCRSSAYPRRDRAARTAA